MNKQATQVLRFTDAYKKYKDSPIAIREGMCLEAQFPHILKPVEKGDLFAGRLLRGVVGFSPDEWGQQAFGYYCLGEELKKLLADQSLTPIERSELEDAYNFWLEENTSRKLRKSFPSRIGHALPSDNWMGDSGVAFPLYRLCGGNLDYDKLMQLGIPGLRQEIEGKKLELAGEDRDISLFEGMEKALDVFVDSCQWYARDCERQAEDATGEHQKELLEMAKILRAITVSAPQSFREATQLFWLYALISDNRNHGRMDVYLGDFLVNDLNAGKITREQALQLLVSLWRLQVIRFTHVHNRIIVGGMGRRNESNANEFAMLAMEASRIVKETEPQLSLRFYEGMDERLLAKALDVLGEGCTYPILYNDDINVPAVEKALDVASDVAKDFVPFGCGEYIIDHQGFGTPSGVINLLKALEVTLRNGRDPLTGKIAGLQLGEFGDFATFEDLWNAYRQQVEYFVEIMAEHEKHVYDFVGEEFPCLFMSMLYDDCIERGKAMFAGGVRYLGGTLETYGNTNTADSLSAIKELVYDEKRFSPEQLLKILDANFAGFDQERQELLAAPKYGNDDKTADEMAIRVHEHVCNFVKAQGKRVGLHSYLVVIINNSANTLMGRQTSASADGRFKAKSMANANNPSGGSDQKGVTAFLNSLVKLDPTIHAGAVQNMKFSPSIFGEHRTKLEALLDVYFQKGGSQAMITVVGRDQLESAIKEPEKYRNLMVRVGGFSARFVTLDKDVQQEILSRTLY